MRILGIETSCDETAAAVVRDGVSVESSVIASSKLTFSELGGVIPEDAARRQVECILPVIESALTKASLKIDAVAVTKGPGLLGSLLVGTTAARTISEIHGIPLIGVHHVAGHLASVWLDAEPEPKFPCITLSASGGHTDLWYRTEHSEGKLLGRTLDDAAGEAFDKGAALLGLPYPGGPSIAKAAATGDRNAFAFPRALQGQHSYDFSFSGLKTSLRYTVAGLTRTLEEEKSDLAASFEHAICLQLVDRIRKAVEDHPDAAEVHVVGGVSANTHLRELIQETIRLPLRTPATLAYCTDNAAMIASAAYFQIQKDRKILGRAFATGASFALETAAS